MMFSLDFSLDKCVAGLRAARKGRYHIRCDAKPTRDDAQGKHFGHPAAQDRNTGLGRRHPELAGPGNIVR
jgi:hypothetical protein